MKGGVIIIIALMLAGCAAQPRCYILIENSSRVVPGKDFERGDYKEIMEIPINCNDMDFGGKDDGLDLQRRKN